MLLAYKCNMDSYVYLVHPCNCPQNCGWHWNTSN